MHDAARNGSEAVLKILKAAGAEMNVSHFPDLKVDTSATVASTAPVFSVLKARRRSVSTICIRFAYS